MTVIIKKEEIPKPDEGSDMTELASSILTLEGESIIQKEDAQETENQSDEWDNDLENPRNWPLFQRWIAMSIVSFYTLIPSLGSTVMAPGLTQVAEKYHITNPTVVALTLSIFLLSFALGPLILAPLSEMYGRTWVLHTSNLVTLAFSLACAYAPTTEALIVFRFISGITGSAPVAVGGGSVSDLFSERDRGSAMALFSIGNLLGFFIGPVAGGLVTQALGIKWVFNFLAITCGVGALIGIPFLRETYSPVIRSRRRRATKISDPEFAAVVQAPAGTPEITREVLWTNLSRPITLLFQSFICFILSLYLAFNYGISYLMFCTFPKLFKSTYDFNPGVGGLAYSGVGIGFIVATIVIAQLADRVYRTLAERNGGKGKPEMRIPTMILGSVAVPVGLLWFGWSAQARLHWIMPIIGTGIFGFGLITAFLPVQLYLVDTFRYAASAISAAAVFRSLLGFAFPLFGQQLFDKLGEGRGNSLFAGLAIVLGIPFPIWIYFKGEQMRARSPLTR